MARKAAVAEGPVSESKRLFDERRKAALAQAKAERSADVGLFGDIGIAVVLPPDPAQEEPIPDEPLSEEDREIERAYQESTRPPSAADVQAVAAMAGAQEGPSAAEALAASEPALTAAEAREALAYMEAAGRQEEAEILGPDSFGGEDGLPAPSAETLRRQIAEDRELLQTTAFGEHYSAGSGAGEVASRAVHATESSPEPAGQDEALGAEAVTNGPPEVAAAASVEEPGASSSPAVLPEGVPFETLQLSGADAEFLESKTDADVAPAQAGGFSLFGHNLFGDTVKAKSSGPLSERFKLPPFTVFDARQGIWQDRKRAWLALGIQSEVGRGENLLQMSDTVLEPDPVKRAEMIKQREKKNKTSAFGQEFILGAQPGVDGKPGGQGKAWHTNDTGISRKLAPGGGGGGAWIGGPKTSSSEKYGREGEADVVLDENGQPLASKTGTSIFDPVLTELVYSWFVPPAGFILDPFAGGSVRGIVAAKLGRMYCGIELRPEQIAANERQAAKICVGDNFQPVWIEGDSTNAKELTDGGAFDFIMACPPYGDLEQYSDDPRDLSNMEYEEFAKAYAKIIEAALGLLKPDRFACYVIGDIRDDKGFYRGLPELTVRAFEEAGARKYNEAILVTSVGSLPIRIGKQFGSGRKLGKTHQNVLVFVKGDPKRAAEACGGQQEFSL
jgi:hypothetical protein